jgi:uncharacterized protein
MLNLTKTKGKIFMKKNISINLTTIGSGIHITFGNSQEKTKNGYHIDSILTEWTQSFLKEFSLSTEEEQQSKISGSLKLIREQSVFRVEGTIAFEPQLECIRSLTLFREKLKTDVQGFFVPLNSQKYQQSGISKFTHQNEGDEVELTESDLESYPFQGNAIQLDEFILDAMFCSLPELPLCRSDCKGLCPECGTDLNEKDLIGNYQIIEHTKKCSHFKPLRSQ